uniref:Uncharacterized protein n=1 Tax=Falco tinnunculus TaxID=100819 RepID=A0A8C4TVR1_FALTI
MGKVCAIFGGSRGVGKGVAVLLAQKGCHLAIIAGNLEVAQTTFPLYSSFFHFSPLK